MTMLSPQAQLTSPFFLGGSHILVSYPTDTMDVRRADAEHARQQPGVLARDGVHHEMIPGHNLVGYLGLALPRLPSESSRSGGPFYGEGWPLYWELTLYELGFHKTPETEESARCSGACTAARASSSR